MRQRIRRRFTVDEYHRMIDVGIFQEDDHVELLAGDIYHRLPLEPVQAAKIKRLNYLLHQQPGDNWIVSIHNPIRLDEYSEPEPHLALLRWRDDFYETHLPTPKDVLLLIEIANAPTGMKRKAKLPHYAVAGIPEVWVVSGKRHVIAQYTQPEGRLYSNRKLVKRGTITTTCLSPAVEVPVEHIFGLKAL